MPFDAFVVYVTAAPHTVRGFGMTQAMADARAAADAGWSAHQGQVSSIPDSADGGGDWQFNTATVAVHRAGQTQADVIAERRATLKSLLREKEQIPGLAAWASGELNLDASIVIPIVVGQDVTVTTDVGIRAKSYSRWVEMMSRASAVDANLSNNISYGVIRAEASIPGRLWYWLHWAGGVANDDQMPDSAPWTAFTPFTNDDRTTWLWYSTFDNGVLTPNSRGAVGDGRVVVGALPGADFNWVDYLGS